MILEIEENDHIQQHIVSLEQIANTAALLNRLVWLELDGNRSISTELL